MSQPFLGEIRLFGFDFAPVGWESCAGQLMAISEFDNLFQLIGTTYGGDGQQTFALPDLRARVPLDAGASSLGTTFVISQQGGVDNWSLAAANLPAHTHGVAPPVAASSTTASPVGTAPGPTAHVAYGAATEGAVAASSSTGSTGAGQPFSTREPYLGLNYCIAVFGIFPAQA